MNKTKSGKKAYYTEIQWIEVRFEELMKSKEIQRGSAKYIELQEMYFLGASHKFDSMPLEWKEKLARKEPI